MTEAEWLAGTNLEAMIAFARGRASARKSHLLSLAWGRFLWDRFPHDASRREVEVEERFVDGLATEAEWLAAHREAQAGIRATYSLPPSQFAPEQCPVVAWAHCIFGNPFRPVSLDPAWLTWNDRTVTMLAQGIYDERAFDRMPVLADALEDAGCTSPDILGHLRGPGPHVRGCWALDLLLRRS